jgi:hypothetical protein
LKSSVEEWTPDDLHVGEVVVSNVPPRHTGDT